MSIFDVSSKWNCLSDLSRVIKQLSEQKCFNSLQDLLNHVEVIQAKVKEQEATIKEQEEAMVAKSNEVIRLKEEYKSKQEENIEFYANVIRKKDDEKSSLKKALTRQEDELSDANTSSQHLQDHILVLQSQLQGQDTEVKKVETQLREVRSKNESLDKDLKDHKDQIKSKDQQLQAEKKAYGELKSQAERLNKRCSELEGELKASDDKFKQINELAPALIEDNALEVSKCIQKIWKQCIRLGRVCFQEDNPPEQLRDPSRWRNLRSSNLITYAVPLPPTNSPVARRMRFFATLSILADSLIRNLFTSTYLVSCAGEVDRVMLEMAETNQRKEALFRRLLNSMSTESEDQLVEGRMNKIAAELAWHIEPLLSIEQNVKMREQLTEILKLASDLWKSLQKRQSYFAVEPPTPSQTASIWKSLFWDEGKKVFSEENTTGPQNIVFLLFPRVFMISYTGEQEIFSGVVLLKPETTAAHAELSELSPTSPSITRTGTHRSAGGRRGTLERNPERDSFLAQNGSHEPSGL